MTTVKHDRAYKLTRYAKGYSVDFHDMPYAWYDSLEEAEERYNTDRLNWYGDVKR